MASTTRRLLFYTSRCPLRISARQIAPRYSIQWRQPLSTTVHRGEDSKTPLSESALASKPSSAAPTESPAATAPGTSSEPPLETLCSKSPRVEKSFVPRAPPEYTELSPDEVRAAQLADLSANLEALDPDAIAEAIRHGKHGLPWSDDFELERDEDFDIEQEQGKPGFWAEGEEDLGPDEDYYGDDITSHGHGELEQHRELREYARLAAWELPLLNQLARPFELPTAATPFRFRYTSYLGEKHPATNKVVVEFSASDMPNLTSLQKDKLIKLSGPRYNPDTDIIKMSCELYDTLAQNKRFLGDTISKLLAEARDGKDTFADVPFDFRHHKPKVRHEFPKEWILTPERKQYLEEKRQRLLKLDDEKMQNGNLVDGQKVIETALPFTMPIAEPAMVSGARGKQLR